MWLKEIPQTIVTTPIYMTSGKFLVIQLGYVQLAYAQDKYMKTQTDFCPLLSHLLERP
jgi:hypothetical protein